MIQTYPVSEGGRPEQASGSYFLAKHVLELAVSGKNPNTTITASVVAVPDPAAQMQIGFELSALADDNIKVDYRNGLLKEISAIAVDRTGDVIVALAKDVGLFRLGKTTDAITKTLQFDPFDERQAMKINRELRKLGPGNCVEVEIYQDHWSPGCGKFTMGGGSELLSVSSPVYAPQTVPSYPGIYYRRALAHRVHIVVNGNTGEIKNYLFANEAPVLRVDIDRTSFVTRQTTVKFDDAGELTSVQVIKGSEALAVAKLPVEIVDAYTSGVVDALVQRKNVEDAKANLYNAQAAEIKARIALGKAQAANPEVRNAPVRNALETGNASASTPTQADCVAAANEKLFLPGCPQQ